MHALPRNERITAGTEVPPATPRLENRAEDSVNVGLAGSYLPRCISQNYHTLHTNSRQDETTRINATTYQISAYVADRQLAATCRNTHFQLVELVL